VARVLLVGCGCRGRALAARLAADGYQVRGTTRDPATLATLAAAGVEAVVADPLRLATLMRAIDGVSAVCWLMGSARGGAEPLHTTRLESLVELLVDTHVRGFVYEAAGSVDAALLERGRAVVERTAAVYGMPAVCVAAAAADVDAWAAEMAAAVAHVLGASG
jgi:uncharacterized protein YbjT (DUF2867 family)